MKEIIAMKLVPLNDSILRTCCKEFDFLNPPFEPIDFAKEFVKFMIDSNGIGLSANQIGIPYKIFALRASPENFVCFNPRIVDSSQETIILEEGCLSFPGISVRLERPKHIKVRFTMPNRETITKKFTGISARAFQHEMDHINGITFVDYLSKFKLKRLIDKTNKNMKTNYKIYDFIMKGKNDV